MTTETANAKHMYAHHDMAEWFCAHSFAEAVVAAREHWTKRGHPVDDQSDYVLDLEEVHDGTVLEFFDEGDSGEPVSMGKKSAWEWIKDEPVGLFFAGEP